MPVHPIYVVDGMCVSVSPIAFYPGQDSAMKASAD